MQKISGLIFFVFLTAAIYAQENSGQQQVAAVTPGKVDNGKPLAAADKKAEETLIFKEDIYDFGKIPQGKPVTHIFEAANTGKQAMNIQNVQASCGCTTPEWEHDKPVPAGANTKITVGYNAAAEGPFTKLVTITYNENLSKQITIKGEVWKTPAASAPANSGLNDLKN